MADYGANLELVPVFMEASNELDLIRFMVLNNQLNQTKHNYMSPIQKKNGRWVVWFYADIKYWNNPTDLSEKQLKQIQGFNR